MNDYKSKVTSALRDALKYLNDIKPSVTPTRHEKMDKHLWKVREDLEYSAFILSITHNLLDLEVDENHPSEVQDDLGHLLLSIIKYVEGALESVDSDVERAYRSVREALGLIRVANDRVRKAG